MAGRGIPGVEVQDNSRETALAVFMGLSTTGKRNGFDALDMAGNFYELKTTSVGDVGTGRDVGRTFVQKLRSAYFIAAKTKVGTATWEPEEIIFCHPNDLEEWIVEKLESRISSDEKLRDAVLKAVKRVFKSIDLERIRYLMDRGMTYNNPKISWAYLESHGTKIDLQRPKAHLVELVNLRPLQNPNPPVQK